MIWQANSHQQTRSDRQRWATISVRYGRMGLVGEFSHGANVQFARHRKVVVQTDRGIEIGEILPQTCSGGACESCVSPEQIARYVDNSGVEYCQPRRGRIMRVASEEDLDEAHRIDQQAEEELKTCRQIVAQHGVSMKLVAAEHLFGGERIIFYFLANSRVDFRSLVRELAGQFQTRIEMRQIGARDEARLVADYEICGRECCCKNFLKVLKPVSMSMAKIQKATLDPGKVSGRCGRLRCCLRFENDTYEELLSRLPPIGAFVRTAHGDGRVVDRQAVTQLIAVQTEAQQQMAVAMEDVLEVAPDGRMPERPAQDVKRQSAGQAGADNDSGGDSEVPSDESVGPSGVGRGRRRGSRRGRGRRPSRRADQSRDV